ncbi:MAG: FkbM family methyltransferase [Opitutaceae bacterium]|nr:FkbM family methyltransferase [Opitutaceae bacterium]
MAESLRQKLQRVANHALHPLGLHLARADRAFEMEGMLERAAARGPAIATWIDVGASDGIWSLRARRHFPQANFLLFEPLAEHAAALRALETSRGFAHVAAAAGSAPGEIAFAIDPLLDGSGVAAPGATDTRTVPMETIDRVVRERKLPGPFGVKLDTHGFELPVLAGAAHTLKSTALLVIEAYNFPLTPDSLRFHELCASLEARGFRCVDLADPMRRPRDGALWQMDLAFARADHPAFATSTYG